jgi:hypothetical protein
LLEEVRPPTPEVKIRKPRKSKAVLAPDTQLTLPEVPKTKPKGKKTVVEMQVIDPATGEVVAEY